MELHIESYNKKFSVELVAANGTAILTSCRMYAHKRSAVKAAKSIAKGKLKVVVKA